MASKDGGSHEPYEMDPISSSRLLTFLLIAAGIAVAAWFLFARAAPRPESSTPQPATVQMTCTCRPAQ